MRPLVLASLFLLAGCEPGSNAARSCAGERVLECDPYEWATVTEAAFEPSAVPIGDPRVRVHVTATLETCGAMTPRAPTVQIQMIVGQDDGGPPRSVVELATVSADAAGATSIDAMIDNPFSLSGTTPPDETVTLRFVPVIGGCDGDALSIPYRTGPVVRP